MKVSVFPNVFDVAELQSLIEFYDSVPISNTRHDDHGQLIRYMKHSQYNLKDTDPYKSWPRNQLHCGSNFTKHGLTKQAIVLWI